MALFSYALSSGMLSRETHSFPISPRISVLLDPLSIPIPSHLHSCTCRSVAFLFHRRYSILVAMLHLSPLLLSGPQHAHLENTFQNMSMHEPNATRSLPAFPFPNYTAPATTSGGCECTHPAPSKLLRTNQKPSVVLATRAAQRRFSLQSHDY